MQHFFVILCFEVRRKLRFGVGFRGCTLAVSGAKCQLGPQNSTWTSVRFFVCLGQRL